MVVTLLDVAFRTVLKLPKTPSFPFNKNIDNREKAWVLRSQKATKRNQTEVAISAEMVQS